MTRALIEHVEHFQRRVLADALQEATVAYWRRRAAVFERVGTPACDEIAKACLSKARFVQMTGLDAEMHAVIADVLAERAA